MWRSAFESWSETLLITAGTPQGHLASAISACAVVVGSIVQFTYKLRQFAMSKRSVEDFFVAESREAYFTLLAA
jgi:hypothetical protein